MQIQEILDHRIMVLDGAMGTMIQQYGLSESDFRGERFADITALQKGNNDLLCLTRPQIISAIHEAYLDAGADIILLDNMTNEMMSQAVQIVQGRSLLEASGGVTLQTVRGKAETGVDFISVGALTHSVPAVDIGLDFI